MPIKTSDISIYKTAITPQLNARIDDIEEYLNTCELVYRKQDFQYLKLGTDLVIKIVADQQYSHIVYGNYIKIIEDGRTYYYFVMEAKWTSTNCVQLLLSIDSINTFWDELEWLPTTHITRRYKDRFAYVSKTANVIKVNKIIDQFSENITPYLIVRNQRQIDQVTQYPNLKWYLIYRSGETETTVVNLSCVASQPISASSGGIAPYDFKAQAPGQTSNMEMNMFYYIMGDDWSADLPTGAHWTGTNLVIETTHVTGGILKLSLVNNGQIQYSYMGNEQSLVSDGVLHYEVGSAGSGETLTTYITKVSTSIHGYYFSSVDTWDQSAIITFSFNSMTGALNIISINGVDRTNSKLIKIIELPYAPFDVQSLINGTIPHGWSVVNGELKWNRAQNTPFNSTITRNALPFDLTAIIHRNNYLTAPPSIQYETKLLNSAFSPIKYAYGPDFWTLKLENLKLKNPHAATDYDRALQIEYTASSDITSGNLFKFSPRLSTTTYEYDADFGQYMSSSRDNEYPIFTSEYLNYLRYGKKYDMSGRNNAIVGSLAQVASSAASGLLMLALRGGTPMGWAGFGISLAAGVTSATLSIANALEAQNEKEDSLRNKAAGISGSSDRDIFGKMTNNKLWEIDYRPTPAMTQLLWKMFMYTGYACDEYAIPRFNTRIRRDFIMCEPHFNHQVNYLYSNFEADLIARFSNGLTVIHHAFNEWDFDFKYENWETWMVQHEIVETTTPPTTSGYVQIDFMHPDGDKLVVQARTVGTVDSASINNTVEQTYEPLTPIFKTFRFATNEIQDCLQMGYDLFEFDPADYPSKIGHTYYYHLEVA